MNMCRCCSTGRGESKEERREKAWRLASQEKEEEYDIESPALLRPQMFTPTETSAGVDHGHGTKEGVRELGTCGVMRKPHIFQHGKTMEHVKLKGHCEKAMPNAVDARAVNAEFNVLCEKAMIDADLQVLQDEKAVLNVVD